MMLSRNMSKAFLKSMKTWWRSCWCRRYFSQGIHRLKICSVVLLPVLKPALMMLIVRQFWHCFRLPFLGSVLIKDSVHGVGHSPVCQILLQIVVRMVFTSSPSAWTSCAGMLLTPADFPFFNDCTAASTSLRRMGWSSSVSDWVQFSTDGSPLAL